MCIAQDTKRRVSSKPINPFVQLVKASVGNNNATSTTARQIQRKNSDDTSTTVPSHSSSTTEQTVSTINKKHDWVDSREEMNDIDTKPCHRIHLKPRIPKYILKKDEIPPYPMYNLLLPPPTEELIDVPLSRCITPPPMRYDDVDMLNPPSTPHPKREILVLMDAIEVAEKCRLPML